MTFTVGEEETQNSGTSEHKQLNSNVTSQLGGSLMPGPYDVRRVAKMKRASTSVCLFLVLSLLVLAAPLPVLAADSDEGACLVWDITGTWQYRASAGGYGTMTYQQDAAGKLTGSWWNEAAQGAGTLTGSIQGVSLGYHPFEGQTWQGTVAPSGNKISGTWTWESSGAPTTNGTWEATGGAICLARQAPPPPGAANLMIQWGEYTWYSYGESEVYSAGGVIGGTSSSPHVGLGLPISPARVTGVARITAPNNVIITITAQVRSQNPPATLTVVNRANGGGPVTVAVLTRVGPANPGGITRYRGTVTIQRWAAFRVVNVINVLDPDRPGREWPAAVVVQVPLIDPSGYIYDAYTNARLEGATVSCFVKQGSQWVLWNAAQYDQTNPQVSDDEGRYGWDVPAGDYLVRAYRHCYADIASSEMHIPPPRTDVNLGMTQTGCSSVQITDISIVDNKGIWQTEFSAGQQIQVHPVVSNTGISDAEVNVVWTCTDPQGQVVDALSGSRTYGVQPGSAVEVPLDVTIPSGAAEGTYTVVASLTHQNQTSHQITQFYVGAGAILYLPAVVRMPTPSAPTPGFWKQPSGEVELYVSTDRANVVNFAIRVEIEGCGRYKITRTISEPITNNQFSFSGPFYASGTFNSDTTASGTLGLDGYPIPDCGTVSLGPEPWNATWQNSSQPSSVRVEATEPEAGGPGTAAGEYFMLTPE